MFKEHELVPEKPSKKRVFYKALCSLKELKRYLKKYLK